jgi:hypothetical protein
LVLDEECQHIWDKKESPAALQQHFWIAWMIFVTLTSRAEMGVQMIQKMARTISFSPWAQVGMEASAAVFHRK